MKRIIGGGMIAVIALLVRGRAGGAGIRRDAGRTVIQRVPLTTDFTGAKVAASDLLQGCLGGQDCIPSIDDPTFESGEQAMWL